MVQKVEPIEEAFLSVIVYRPDGEQEKASKFTNDVGKILFGIFVE